MKEKRLGLLKALNDGVVAAAKISPDDLLITLYETPGENISFGRGVAHPALQSEFLQAGPWTPDDSVLTPQHGPGTGFTATTPANFAGVLKNLDNEVLPGTLPHAQGREHARGRPWQQGRIRSGTSAGAAPWPSGKAAAQRGDEGSCLQQAFPVLFAGS